MKVLSTIFISIFMLFSGYVMAADLTSAKASGLIGEQANGYIGFVKLTSDEVKYLVKEVNAKRKAKYTKIAKSKNIPLSDVEKIAGKAAMKKTISGNYIKLTGSDWVKKR